MTATVVAPSPGDAGRWRSRLREAGQGRHPQWWLAVAAVVGWAVLGTLDVVHLVAPYGTGGAGSSDVHAGHGHVAAAAGAPALAHAWVMQGTGMLAMVAVMVPLVARNVRYAALRAPASRRATVVRWVTGGWAASWGLVLVPLAALVWLAASATGPVVTVLLAAVVAVGWQWSPWKRVALARCDRVLAPPLPRRAAGVACRRFGLRLGWSCAASCGPMMLLMLAGGHSVAVVAPLVAVSWYERRRRPHHDPARGATSWVIALAGAVALAVTSFG